MTRPLADRDSAAWWQAIREHRLQLQQCNDCRTPRWPPRAMCNACTSFDWSWIPASGDGAIASWTVSHRSLQPERTAPYVVVLVRLAEAENLLLPGSWAGSDDGTDLAVGLPVHVHFLDYPTDGQGQDAPTGFTLLGWLPKRV